MDKAKISATILLLITIAIVLSFNFDVTTVHDADQSLLYVNESQTLSPTEQGITSSSLYALNNSYLEFDGVDDYVTLPSAFETTRGTNNFTISLWVKLDQDKSQIIYRNTLGTPTSSISIGYDTTGAKTIRTSFWNGTANLYQKAIPHTVGSYAHIVVISDGSSLRLFQNGIEGTTTGLNPTQGSAVMHILGGDGDVNRHINGFLDEVRIYNRSLEESEITEIYNSGRYKNLSLPSDGLVLYMPFEETNGTTIYDNSGNNNNGVLIYE